MSDYSSMSAPPPPEGHGAQTRGEKPPSIKTAINIIWAYIAVSVIGTILSFATLDDVVDDVMAAQPAESAITEEMVRTTTVIFSVVFLLIVIGLSVLLAIFLGKGHNWARIVLTVLAGLGAVFGLIGLLGFGGATPVLTLVIQLISLALAVALIFFLWRKDSSQWLTGRP